MFKSAAILCGILFLQPSNFAQAAEWPPETGAKVAGNALEMPTKLVGITTSLEDLLNTGAEVIASSLEDNGPVITVKYRKQFIVCILKGAGIGSDQKIATSKCYALN
jgi:hypothetical protein